MTDKTSRNQLRSLRVLLAEDSRLNQTLAIRLLEAQGHAVTVVSTGKEAVDAVRHGAFDVVLMDIDMPEMDGLSATRVIRADEEDAGARVPIVAVTTVDDPHAFLEAGMDAYLPKPLRLERLNRTLLNLLNRPAA
jgi:CheY-like chemotaxis protein